MHASIYYLFLVKHKPLWFIFFHPCSVVVLQHQDIFLLFFLQYVLHFHEASMFFIRTSMAKKKHLCVSVLYISDVQMTSSLADESELILQLVTDHSMKLFFSEVMLSEATHSVAVLSLRKKSANR